MTRTVRTTLTAAAALVAALVALPARADHDDGWRRGPPPRPGLSASVTVYGEPEAPPVAYPAPAPAYAVPAPVPAPPAFVNAPVRPARWGAGWRFAALRHEYRELEQARERFYATWDGRPWARARFEAWYASWRAALGARWAELGRWAR